MPPLPHRIRRLSFRVRATSTGEALALRKEMRDRMDTTLMPSLSRAFDAAGASDEVIYIPKLELRIGISASRNIAEELGQRIGQELVHRLSAMRVALARPAERSDATTSSRTGFVELPQASIDALVDGERAASFRAPVDLLIQYLKTGSLPWPLASLDSALVVTELRDAACAQPEVVLDSLVAGQSSVRAQVAFWFRWLQLLPDADWPVVARAAALRSSSAESAELTEVVAVLAEAQASALSRYARLQLAAAAIATVRRTVDPANIDELAAIVLHAAGGGGRDRGASPAAGNEQVENGASIRAVAEEAARLPEPAATAFRKWLNVHSKPRGAATTESHASKEPGSVLPAPMPGEASGWSPSQRSEALHSADGRSQARIRVAPWPLEAPGTLVETASTAPQTDSEAARRSEPLGQVVRHAGLILLYPFLPRFFESTAVKKAGDPELLSSELSRAAALLHWLATADEEAFELNLGFIKVLLGLTIDSQLPVSEGLVVASDRKEAEALLTAVIEHWHALKNTSVTGLRSSFLQRQGLVREENQGFRLQMEPAPFDMLLAQLPWGIGTVKLSWMKKVIFTDWPAP